MREVEKLIAHFGGQSATARALGIRQPSVCLWSKGGNISPVLAKRAEVVTGGLFTAERLRPDVFGKTAA